MKTSELITRLQEQPGDQEAEIFIGGVPAEVYSIGGVGTRDPNNGTPVRTVIVGLATPAAAPPLTAPSTPEAKP